MPIRTSCRNHAAVACSFSTASRRSLKTPTRLSLASMRSTACVSVPTTRSRFWFSCSSRSTRCAIVGGRRFKNLPFPFFTIGPSLLSCHAHDAAHKGLELRQCQHTPAAPHVDRELPVAVLVNNDRIVREVHVDDRPPLMLLLLKRSQGGRLPTHRPRR